MVQFNLNAVQTAASKSVPQGYTTFCKEECDGIIAIKVLYADGKSVMSKSRSVVFRACREVAATIAPSGRHHHNFFEVNECMAALALLPRVEFEEVPADSQPAADAIKAAELAKANWEAEVSLMSYADMKQYIKDHGLQCKLNASAATMRNFLKNL